MAREINKEQPFQDKVVKLIPTEIVGAYLVILGIISPADSQVKIDEYALIGAFVFLLLLTPIYLWKVSGVTNKTQLLVSTTSYVIWVYTLTYPFKYWNWHYPTIGAVVLVLWSLIIPIFVTPPPEEPEGANEPVNIPANEPINTPVN